MDSLDELDESGLDQLKHIPQQDLDALRDEVYSMAGASNPSEKFLRELCKLRRGNASRDAYSVLPLQERTKWSAWYLKDIT